MVVDRFEPIPTWVGVYYVILEYVESDEPANCFKIDRTALSVTDTLTSDTTAEEFRKTNLCTSPNKAYVITFKIKKSKI